MDHAYYVRQSKNTFQQVTTRTQDGQIEPEEAKIAFDKQLSPDEKI